jgi:Na+/H+ antiporter NhaD/arsenite permease-like protein
MLENTIFFYISEQLNKDTEKNISHKKHELILFIIGVFFCLGAFVQEALDP